jgi:sulfofructose kinase
MVDRRGERCIVAYRRGLPEDASLIPDDPLDDVAVVLVDSRWPEGAEVVLDRARRKGIVTVLDADGGPRDFTLRLIGRSDHVVFSSEGLRDFLGDGEPEELLARCPAERSQVMAVTRGAAGSLWRIDGQKARQPAFKVIVTDTTGCGDVFHDAYALALAEGLAPAEAARFASATAAVKAERGRGGGGMPDRAAVDGLLAGRR